MGYRDDSVVERNIEWSPPDDELYDYMAPLESLCNTDRIKEKDKFSIESSEEDIKAPEPYDDWCDVYHEIVNVHLTKPPKGENKDKTPGARAKPDPWSLPDKGYGDVFDKRHGVWVGSRVEPPKKVIFPWEKESYGAIEESNILGGDGHELNSEEIFEE